MSKRKAAQLWEDFHWGEQPTELFRATLDIPSPSETLYVLGRLRRIDYETTKDGERAIFFHHFGRPWPYLASTVRGSLVIAGGGYRIEPRGIVG